MTHRTSPCYLRTGPAAPMSACHGRVRTDRVVKIGYDGLDRPPPAGDWGRETVAKKSAAVVIA